MRLVMHSIACSLLVGCVTVERPDSNNCLVNAPGGHKVCYNMLRDYDNDGNLLPDAKPSIVPILSLDDLNKNICHDPDSWAGIKSYIGALREAAKGK